MWRDTDRETSGMKVALVHDWLTGMRGGEKALEAICLAFPDADLFTLLHVPGSVSATIERRQIRTSFVQHLPAAARLYRHYLPLLPVAIEQFSFDGYDLVISVSHCAAKSIVHTARTKHVCHVGAMGCGHLWSRRLVCGHLPLRGRSGGAIL